MKRTGITPQVRRGNGPNFSKQPRFDSTSRGSMFSNFVSFIKRTTEQLEIPAYLPNSMIRDQWLQKNWMLEPHWGGVLNQTVLIDSSRAWAFTGGRNQVRRFSEMLHQADGGKGWRHFFRRESLGYRTTDMGAITELGRDGIDGPLRAIYHLDSSRCRWTGNEAEPLQYNPVGRGPVPFDESDFFNVSSMPNPQESFNGLGYCQTSRAWDLVRLLYAVLVHDQELTGARFPKGILFFHNVTEAQFKTMLRGRDAELDAKNYHYFGGLMVVNSEGDETPDGKLLALSQLPTNFDRATFIDQTMYGYALVAGYDPREFWPVRGGTLGDGGETEAQDRKATGKGAVEFSQGWQDRFQQELPPTLLFGFEGRDAAGELLDAEVAQAWADVGKTLYEAGIQAESLMDRQSVLKLLADNAHILSPEDVEMMSEAIATDEETTEVTERALMSPQVRRAIERYPNEPIVKYAWPTGVERVLWERGDDALRPRVWRGAVVARQDESEILYESPDGDVVITADDVDRAVVDWDRTMPDDAGGLLEAESVE